MFKHEKAGNFVPSFGKQKPNYGTCILTLNKTYTYTFKCAILMQDYNILNSLSENLDTQNRWK